MRWATVIGEDAKCADARPLCATQEIFAMMNASESAACNQDPAQFVWRGFRRVPAGPLTEPD
jgi:hypothetical protein